MSLEVCERLFSTRGTGIRVVGYLMAFAEDTKVCLRQRKIFEPELKNFRGAQAIEQHQGRHGEITKRAEAVPETGDLASAKRDIS